jgi:hypothetical protein
MGISLGYGKHFDSLKGQGVSTRRTDFFRDDVLESDFTITPDSYPLRNRLSSVFLSGCAKVTRT